MNHNPLNSMPEKNTDTDSEQPRTPDGRMITPNTWIREAANVQAKEWDNRYVPPRSVGLSLYKSLVDKDR